MIHKFNIFNKYILIPSLLLLFALSFILLVFPIGYSDFSTQDFTTNFWIFITLSCNPPAIAVSVLSIIFVLLISTGKYLKLYHSLVILLFIVAGIGIGNFMISHLKESFPKPRPYYSFLSESNILPKDLTDFIKLSPQERMQLFKKDSIFSNTPIGINSLIYELWLSETALTFPSGHAFNSVFLGIIYSTILFFVLNNKIKFLYILPLIWMVLVCVSRVILGFHYIEDVLIGALLGFLSAILFVYIGALNKLMFLNKNELHDKA